MTLAAVDTAPPAPVLVERHVEAGWTDRRIANEYEFFLGQMSKVRNFRRRHRIERKKVNVVRLDVEEVRRLVEGDLDDAQIAVRLKVTAAKAKYFRRRNGIPLKHTPTTWGKQFVVGKFMDMAGTRWGRGSLGVDAIADLYAGRRYGA